MGTTPDVHMTDAPPVQPINGVIDPGLESYTASVEAAEDTDDNIVVNGADHVESPAEPMENGSTHESDIALPTTEKVPEEAFLDEPQDSPTQAPQSGSTADAANGVAPSSPLTDLANSTSPEQTRLNHDFRDVPDSPSSRRHSSRPSRPVERYSTISTTGRQSHPPPPSSAHKSRTKSRTPAPARAASKQHSNLATPPPPRQSSADGDVTATGGSHRGSVKSESGPALQPRALSASQALSEEEDEASMRLIREIMGEERGLRRRGSR